MTMAEEYDPEHLCPKVFKSPECGYTGFETWCDHSFMWCRRLGNVENFGGDACDYLEDKKQKGVLPE